MNFALISKKIAQLFYNDHQCSGPSLPLAIPSVPSYNGASNPLFTASSGTFLAQPLLALDLLATPDSSPVPHFYDFFLLVPRSPPGSQ